MLTTVITAPFAMAPLAAGNEAQKEPVVYEYVFASLLFALRFCFAAVGGM